MKLVSKKKAHIHAISQGQTVNVNGVVFSAGDDGQPTALNVPQHVAALFEASPGFSIYHDDGTYSRPSGQARRLETVNIEEASNRLRVAADEAKTEDAIIAMIQTGTLTPRVLDALNKVVPVVGNAPAIVTTVSGDQASFTVTQAAPAVPAATLIVPMSGNVQVSTPATPDAPKPGAGEPQGEDTDKPRLEQDQTDMSDPESLAKLPRSELFGLARGFGVKVKASDKSIEIAEEIAAAFKETDEYKKAQAGLLPEQQQGAQQNAEQQ